LARFKLRLLIAGEFWEDKKRYLRLIDELGVQEHVTLVDRYIRNEELPACFCASDLVVLPYTSVTGNGVLQLAFAFGRPVVASAVGSFPRIIEDK
jgi:glycosyltransferase involved in cell wall biosynthesis